MAPFRALSSAAFALLLAVTTVPASAAEPLSPDQQDAVRQVVIDLLRTQPELVVEALQAFQQRQEAEQRALEKNLIATLKKDLEGDPNSPVVGNPNGDVTIVEFSDYRCGYCKKVFPSIQTLLKEDGKIRFVIKEFPVLGEESVIAARIAQAAWFLAPRKYPDLHTAMMANRGAMTEDKLLQMAEGLGLARDKLKAMMNAPEVDQAIKKTYGIAEGIGVRGTPAFVVGGRLVPGAVDIDTLRKLVAEARKG